MRATFPAVVLSALFLVLQPDGAHAQQKKSAGPGQDRMKACSAQAARKSLQGRKRQEFMSACLKQPARKSGRSSPP